MTKNNEVWRDIEGYEGLYQVSSLGRVKSLDRYITNSLGYTLLYKGVILKPRVSDFFKYYTVQLNNKDRGRSKSVHRLVAETFIPNPDNLEQVNHIDENKLNNNVTNLEWCTPKENINHGTSIERRSEKLKQKVAKYSKCGKLIKKYDYMTQVELDGYDQGSVSKVCNGIRPHHKGYIWRYADE